MPMLNPDSFLGNNRSVTRPAAIYAAWISYEAGFC